MRASSLAKLILVGTLLLIAVWGLRMLSQNQMEVVVSGIDGKGRIDLVHALCLAEKTAVQNRRPEIRWSGAPEGTQSFVVLVTDPDVPVDLSVAGKAGVEIEANAPRQLFYHWAVYDIPANVAMLEGGKATTSVPGKVARNDLKAYTNELRYGGPCPPPNDARLHHYHFTVLALSVPTLELPQYPKASEVLKATEGKVLAQGEMVGTYTLNPALLQPAS